MTGLLTAVLGLVTAGAWVWLLLRSFSARQKAAAILYEQREWFRLTLAVIGDAVIATDTEGKVTFLNAVAQSLTGWTEEEARGTPLETVFKIASEETRKTVENPALRALEEGRIVGLANHKVLISKTGNEYSIADSAAPIRNAEGTITGAVLVFRDISERRKADMEGADRNRLTALRADTSAALNMSDDPRIALQQCTASLVRHLDVAFARIWTLDAAGTVLELRASAGLYTHLDGPHGRVTVGEFKIGRIAQNRQPLLTNDVPHDPNISDPAWAEREGMVAFAGYPLLVGEEVVGVMAMFARVPISENVLEDLRPIAASIAQFIHRKRAEAALRESNERVTNVLASITDAFVTLDKEWRFTFLNQRAQEIVFPLQEPGAILLGRNLWQDFPDLVGTIIEENCRRCMDEQVTVSFELYYPPLDGWYEVRAYPAKDGLSVYSQDISERKRTERALSESDERYRAATAAVSDLIWTNNADGLMQGEQRGWGDFTGQSRDEYQGYGWSKAVHPDDAQPTIDEWNRAVAEKRVFVFEHRVRRRDGQWRLCSIRAVPILTAEGTVREWVGVHTDITERKRDEERLRQLAAELSEAHHRKDEFLATLAHELRNPLAPIRTGLQLMKLAGPQNAEKVHSMMDRQVTQLVRLIDDLMDVTRISLGKFELRKERVQLADVLNSALETSRPLIERMGHQLTITLPKQSLIVDADMTRLAQVFLNLLNNAAKYSDPGGHIHMNVERQGSEAVVTVKDTGIGIAADQLPRIFEMFTQLDHSLEKSQGGLGIGLTLVKTLVEMHGGRVEARSEGPGKGSEFVMRLPVAVEASRPQDSGNEAEQHVKSSHRILVVDDNRDGADSLSEVLRIMGNDTRTAYDGQEGVDVAGEFQPDVLLLDIGLPKLNGYEVCRRIRKQSWGKNIVLIAVTGWGQDDDRRRSKEAGFDHHLVKPVDPQALMKLLAGLDGDKPGYVGMRS